MIFLRKSCTKQDSKLGSVYTPQRPCSTYTPFTESFARVWVKENDNSVDRNGSLLIFQ